MALTKIGTDGVKDDAVTSDKVANAINSAIAANTAKTQTTINNNADNRVITGSGTANTLEGESNLTYGGGNLQFTTAANGQQVLLKSTGNFYNQLSFDSNNTSAGGSLAFIDFSWDGDKVADIMAVAGSDTTNKDDGHLAFRTSPQQGNIGERMRIDSSGNVGIGTIAPSELLTINGADKSVLIRTSSATGTAKLIFEADGTNYGGVGLENTALVFRCDNASANNERMRILPSGGLTFNGDTAAANALDDYEEGTFTPSYSGDTGSGSYGYSTQAGKYTKVGNTVYFQLYVIANAINTNATGNTLVTGLPFTSTGGNDYGAVSIGYYASWNNIVPSQALIDINQTRIYIYKNNPTSGVTGSSPTDIAVNCGIILSGHYYTTA